MKKIWVILFLAVVVGGVIADEDHHVARELQQSGVILPLGDILVLLKAEFPEARILEVELEREDGVVIYEIELLDSSGQVWELEVDAANGRLLERELEE